MEKIICISDTHNRHKHLTSKAMGDRLPEGDLLIHAGDFSGQGQKGEVQDFLKWLKEVSSKYTNGIVFIAGNHDKSFDPKFNDEISKPEWLQDELAALPSNIIYLENSYTTINGIKIWGSPVTPWFHGDRWAFNKQRGFDINDTWNQIPTDTDIIVTHGPIHGKLDFVLHDSHYAGCEELRYKIKSVKPKLHVCGHIHEGYGYDYDDDTIYVNASICTGRYEPNNHPITIKNWEYESR
jgi:Icc-related predicted phosphoesterase